MHLRLVRNLRRGDRVGTEKGFSAVDIHTVDTADSLGMYGLTGTDINTGDVFKAVWPGDDYVELA